MRITEIILPVLQTAGLLQPTPTSRCAGSLQARLLHKKFSSAFCSQRQNLALVLLMHGACKLPCGVLRNKEWRPVLSSEGFVEVTYTKRCLCLFDYRMLH